MAFEIIEINQKFPDKINAIVNHCGHIFEANLIGNVERVIESINQKIIAEIDYESLSSWRKLDSYMDELSCISRAVDNSNIVIRGRVHNKIALNEESFILDIYLQNGPEFVTIHSCELDSAAFEVGDGIELHITKIILYPVNI